MHCRKIRNRNSLATEIAKDCQDETYYRYAENVNDFYDGVIQDVGLGELVAC